MKKRGILLKIISLMMIFILSFSTTLSVFAEETEPFVVQEDNTETIIENSDTEEESIVEDIETEPIVEEYVENNAVEESTETIVEDYEEKVEEQTEEIIDDTELVEQTLTATSGGGTVTVSGEMPNGTTVSATKLYQLRYIENQVNEAEEIEGEETDAMVSDCLIFEAITAYDITLYNKDGSLYQPVDNGTTVEVTIEDEKIEDLGEEEKAEVYRVDDVEDEVTKMEVTSQEEGSITFETEHFTTYTIGTTEYSTTDNIVVLHEHKGITWTLYDNGLCVGTGDGSTQTATTTLGVLFGETDANKIKYIVCDCKFYKVAPAFFSSDNAKKSSVGYWSGTNIEYLPNLEYFGTGTNFSSVTTTTLGGWFSNCDKLNYIDLSRFNTVNVVDMSGMFDSCDSLTSVNLSSFNTSKVTDMSYMFYFCNALSLDLSTFNTANVIDMSHMFAGCVKLRNVTFGANFITSKVTTMQQMFYECKVLTSLDLSTFDTSNVTNMSEMFYFDKTLWMLNLSSFNTSKVTNMSYMFEHCWELSNLILGNNFKTDNVKDMRRMFNSCYALTSLDLSKFNTQNVTTMYGMFQSCKFTTLDLSGFDTSNVTTMYNMFDGCRYMKALILGTKFKTSKVTNMSNMFDNCSALTSLDLSTFNTSNVTDMTRMFYNCSALTSLDLSKFDMSKCTKCDYMLVGCMCLKFVTSPKTIPSTLNILFPTTIYYLDDIAPKGEPDSTIAYSKMINGTTNLSHSYIGYLISSISGTRVNAGIKTVASNSGVTKIKQIVFNKQPSEIIKNASYEVASVSGPQIRMTCIDGIVYIYPTDSTAYIKANDCNDMFSNSNGCLSSCTNIDVSWFNTSSVTNMVDMFEYCYSLVSIDVSTFDTANVTNMSYMFFNCTALTSLDLSTFNTAKVTNMASMFSNCSALTSLDLSKFNTAKVTTMNSMFSKCSALTSLDVSTFNTINVTDISYMFRECSALTTLDLSTFDMTNCKYAYYMIDSENLKWIKAPYIIPSNCNISLPKPQNKKWYLDDALPLLVPDIPDSCIYCEQAHTYIREDIEGIRLPNSKFQNGILLNGLLHSLKDIDTVKDIKIITKKSIEDLENLENKINVATEDSLIPIYASIEDINTYTETKYVHTSNIDDAGEQSGTYSNNLTRKDKCTVDGVSNLHVRLTYGTETNYDYLYVFKGAYEGTVTKNMQAGQLYTYNGNIDTPQTVEFDVEGDTITFAFYSDDNNGGYGYYAEVSDKSKAITYKGLRFHVLDGFDVYLNEDSSYMLSGIPNLQSVDLSKLSAEKVETATDMFSTTVNKVVSPVNISDEVNISLPSKDGYAWYLDDDFPENMADSEETYNSMMSDAVHTYIRSDIEGFKERPNYDYSKLCTGKEFSTALKSLSSSMKNITEIRYVKSKPSAVTSGMTVKDVSSEGAPVYMAYKSGIIYIYPYDSNIPIYANEDCSNMFCNKSVKAGGSGDDASNLSGCTKLDVSWFDTRYTTNFKDMFWRCKKLTALDVSHFDTSKGTNFSGMFARCGNIISLDLTNFDTSNGTDFSEMFYWDGDNMQTLNLGGFDISKGTNFTDMLTWCTKITTFIAPKTIPEGVEFKLPTYNNNNKVSEHNWYLDDRNPKKMPDTMTTYTRAISNVTNMPHTYIREDLSGRLKYAVTLPAQIKLNEEDTTEEGTAYKGTYKVSVQGTLNSDECIEIKPNTTFELNGTTTGQSVNATISQPITQWKSTKTDDDTASVNEEVDGVIDATIIEPDIYNGVVIFTFGLKEAS